MHIGLFPHAAEGRTGVSGRTWGPMGHLPRICHSDPWAPPCWAGAAPTPYKASDIYKKHAENTFLTAAGQEAGASGGNHRDATGPGPARVPGQVPPLGPGRAAQEARKKGSTCDVTIHISGAAGRKWTVFGYPREIRTQYRDPGVPSLCTLNSGRKGVDTVALQEGGAGPGKWQKRC